MLIQFNLISVCFAPQRRKLGSTLNSLAGSSCYSLSRAGLGRLISIIKCNSPEMCERWWCWRREWLVAFSCWWGWQSWGGRRSWWRPRTRSPLPCTPHCWTSPARPDSHWCYARTSPRRQKFRCWSFCSWGTWWWCRGPVCWSQE